MELNAFELLNKAIKSAYSANSMDQVQTYLTSADRFFEMVKEDIVNGMEKMDTGFTDQSISDYEREEGGYHALPGDIQVRESFMATRAGFMGETFGEAPHLSQCCQQEIVDNDKCSHCGNVCKEMPSENVKLNEAVNKMKKLF